jgi:restriction endonuclease S subunit
MMIKPTENVNNTFLLFLLEKILSEQNETGSGVKMAIRATELSRILTIKPPKNLQDAFADFFDNVVDLKKNIIVQISSLKELLNKKMSDFYGDVDD